MPFTRSPTLTMRSNDAARPRPRRAETASPPRRSNTRKVNVVSKASLAMFNPAHAMGIDAGPSWCEEEERAWQERQRLQMKKSPQLDEERHAGSPLLRANTGLSEESSQWMMSPTPELEAFMTTDGGYTQKSLIETDSALGITMESQTMERKASSESVFEDDEFSAAKKKSGGQNGAGSTGASNSSLSRFFSWKRNTKGKASNPMGQTAWQVPHSAPPHIETFDLQSAWPGMGLERSGAASSLPNTPVDVCASLPATHTTSSQSNGKMARKSSMPSLREIRRATTSPYGPDTALPDVSKAAASSFYWRSDEAPSTPVLESTTPVLPSTPSGFTTAKAGVPRTCSRISSVGRGAARKSTMDILMPTASTGNKSPKKKKRFEPWMSPDMPPLPIHNSAAAPTLSPLSQQLGWEENEESTSVPAPTVPTARQTRRRSRSVGAPPALSMFGTPPMPSPLLGKEGKGEEGPHQVVRVSRGIVGVSSPKLLVRASPKINSAHSMATGRDGDRLQPFQAPVVVNVMPPTPDLGANQDATFEGRNASPGVRRSLSEAQMSSLVQGHDFSGKPSVKEEEEHVVPELDTGDDSFLPYVSDSSYSAHRRSQSTISDLSDFTTSTASEAPTEGADEPFSFTRSLSSLSLSSDGSCAESDVSEEEGLQNAKILSASSTTSSFSRAQLVSPGSRDFAGFSSSNLSGSSLSATSSDCAFSMPSSQRSSKRLSGLPSLSSGQSLASLMTTSTSILDFGSDTAHVRAFSNSDAYDLSSPVELQGGQAEEGDCDTPRLSGGCNATMATNINTTKPLIVRKVSSNIQPEPTTLSPASPRPYPRAHNATSPRLELDLSLPLDLHEIGLGLEAQEVPRKRERPRVPQKSRARGASRSGEPKTPPSSNRLLSSAMMDDRRLESFGLGLGLGLDEALQFHNANGQSTMTASNSTSNGSNPFGFAI